MDGETKVNETNTRTRINVSISARGLAQWDCTCEYDTPEKSIEEMSKAIDQIRSLLKEKGLQEAGTAASGTAA
jgi:protein-tyrosine phosphatase